MRAGLLLLLFSSCAASPRLPASPAISIAQEVQELQQLQDPDADYPSEFYARTGLMLGVRAHGSRLGGDFDGDTTLTGPDTIFLSDTDEGQGYELVAGGMLEGTSWEVSYTRIEHEGEFAGLPGDVEYRAFTLRGIHYWRANQPVQPMALMGMLFPLADIEDGSSDGVNVGTGKLRAGFGVELGGGFAWWLSRHLALDLRGTYVFQWFGQAEGVADNSEDIDNDVYAPSYGVSIGLCWVPGGKE